MQGAAPQGPQQGMPQGQQGMPMPPANDPRMAAAMDVVEADIPESLQQVVDENKFAQEAMELLQSAGGQAAMNQTPPTPPTVAERVGQKAEEGVAGLLARLSPGIQQQGQQMARAQQRPPMQGQRPPMPQQGMAGMPARNMQGMARGGVVGYAGPDGSQVKPTPGAMPQNVLSSDQIKQDAAMYQQLKAGLAAAKTPEGKARVQMQLDALIRDMGNEHGKVMQYIDSTKGFVHPRSQMAGGGIIGYQDGGRVKRYQGTSEDGSLVTNDSGLPPKVIQNMDFLRRVSALQAQLVKPDRKSSALDRDFGQLTAEEREFNAKINAQIDLLTAGRTELKQSQFKTTNPQTGPFPQRPSSLIDDSSVGIATGGAAQDTFDPPVGATTAPPFTSVIGDATEAQILAAFGADANAAATTRGDRARELMGLEGLMAERKALQGEARGLREERFSPERMKKRTWRAGLAGLAEKGLGGFGSGATTERDKIDAERAAAAGISIDEMNSLITELRAMGMTQFEAENKARDVVETRATNAINAGASINAEQSRANQNQLDREAIATQGGLNRASQRAIAEIQTSGSQFGRSLGIRIKALRAQAGPDVSQIEIENQALQSLVDDDLRSALGRLGIQENDQNRKIINDSIEAATKIFQGNITNMSKDPAVLQEEIFTLAKQIRKDLYGSTPSTRNPNTPPLTAFDGQ